jgi:hypothetical protein
VLLISKGICRVTAPALKETLPTAVERSSNSSFDEVPRIAKLTPRLKPEPSSDNFVIASDQATACASGGAMTARNRRLLRRSAPFALGLNFLFSG